jgi:excisionase family DNA binding protein
MSDEFKPEVDSDFLRVKEAAAICNASQRTIWRMIADGQLTAYRFRRCTRLLRLVDSSLKCDNSEEVALQTFLFRRKPLLPVG